MVCFCQFLSFQCNCLDNGNLEFFCICSLHLQVDTNDTTLSVIEVIVPMNEKLIIRPRVPPIVPISW